MRRFLLILGILVPGCGTPEAGQEAVLENAPISAPTVADSAEGSAGLVSALYRDYEWEASGSFVPGRRPLIDEPRDVLRSYFSDELADLILLDRACTAGGDICNLNFSPLWASNDPAADDIEVSSTANAEVVVVRFRYPGNQQLINIGYRLIQADGNWRVDDIEYQDGSSLRQILGANAGI